LLRVKLPSRDEGPEADLTRTEKLVETLMGRRPELRFDYIQKNARFAHDLDV
jgi:topoisomerase-4 subunit B